MNIIVGRVYEHYKGNQYKVIAIAREEDLGVDFVVHRGLHDGRDWVRSVQNFTSLKDGHTARFRLVD